MAKIIVISFCLKDEDNVWFLNKIAEINTLKSELDKAMELMNVFRAKKIPFLMREYDVGRLVHGNIKNFNKDLINQLRTMAVIEMQKRKICRSPSVVSFIIPDEEIFKPDKEIIG